MALGFLNRVGFRAASSGTGSFVVNSALTGMQTPAQAAGPVVVNSNTYRYFAQSDDNTEWEYGFGVYTTGDVTLTRATILDNSSGGTTALSFAAAPKVFMGGPLAYDARVLLVDGTIGSSVESISLSLPSGYASFCLELYRVVLDVGDGISFAFSDDGGSTWIADTATDYSWNYADSANGGGVSLADAVGGLAVNAGGTFISVVASIWPGATGEKARATATIGGYVSGGLVEVSGSQLDAQTGRVNAILLFPYGNGDAPPTGGGTFDSGFYRLWGLPGA